MHWFLSFRAQTNPRGKKLPRQGTRSLSVEALESRWLPSSSPVNPIQVLSVVDSRGRNLIDTTTNHTTPKITGTGPAYAAMSILINGNHEATAFSNAQGKWTVQIRTPIPEGVHSIRAALANSPQVMSNPVFYTVDTTAPTVRVNAPMVFGLGSTVMVQSQDNGAIQSLWLDLDPTNRSRYAGNNLGYALLQEGNNRLPDLPAGRYQMRVRAIDQAGNVGLSNPFVVQIQQNGLAGLGDTWLMRLASLGNNVPAAKPVRTPSAVDTLNQISDDQLRQMFYVEGNRVLVAARAKRIDQTDDFLHSLTRLGMQVINVTRSSALITGWLPSSLIPALQRIPNFAAATAVMRHVTRAGAVQTEGDGVLNGPGFRAGNGVDGTGQKVGVISDSVDQVGGGIAASQATGDLPPIVENLADFAGGSDEGRAMLEIVHDVAPGAALAFHTGVGGAAVFATAIRELAAAGCTSIVDDLGYANSPVFNAGRMGQAIEEVWRQGVFYATAAGNDGSFAWRGAFNATAARVGTVSGQFAQINGGVLQRFILPVGETIDFKFNWDNPYLEGGSPLPNYQVTADLAVHVVNPTTGAILATFNTNNIATGEAFERIVFTNAPAFLTNTFAFAFQLVRGPAPQRIAWISFNSTVNTINVAGEGASTIYGQVLAQNAMSVGAVNWVTPDTPEPFSSLGGNLPVVADDLTGARFSKVQIRQKPNVMGPDGVSTTLTDFSPFFGTSAAAPHIAAVAALVFQQEANATNADVFEHLEGTAIPLPGTNGFNPVSGWGRVFLRAFRIGQDRFDPNISSDQATNLGTLGNNPLTLTNLTIRNFRTGLPDYDWFMMSPSKTGRISATISNSRLQVFVYVRRNGFLTQVPQGYRVQPGDVVYVQVNGRPLAPSRQGQGVYDLTLTLL